MSYRLAPLGVAAIVALSGVAAAAGGNYGFTQHDLLVQQAALQYSLNHTPAEALLDEAYKLLGETPPVRPPVLVRCRGVNPVRLGSGATGWYEIRCTTSLQADDYVYTLNSKGYVVTHRVNPNSP